MAMAIRWKLKFGNGEWQWPFTGNGIFGSMNGQVAIRHKKWPFVFLAIRLPGPKFLGEHHSFNGECLDVYS